MNGVLIIMVFAGICSAVVKYQLPVPIPDMPDLKMKKLAGRWYPIAMVIYDNAYNNEPRQVYGYVMEPRPDGNLRLKIKIPRNGTCRQRVVLLYFIRRGEFDTADDKVTVRIVDTDHETYHIIHFTYELTGMMQLYGREQTVPDEVHEKFRTLAQDLQFNPNTIYNVSENKLCL